MSRYELTEKEAFHASFNSRESRQYREERDRILSNNLEFVGSFVGETLQIDFEYPLEVMIVLDEESGDFGFLPSGDSEPTRIFIDHDRLWTTQSDIENACLNELYLDI